MSILTRSIGISVANNYASGVAWSPASLPGLNSWFRADSNVTLATGKVSAIGDKSGAAVLSSLSQATAGAQPLFVASGINALADITWGTSTALGGNQTLLGSTALTLACIFKTSQATLGRLWGMSYNGYDYGFEINRVAGALSFFINGANFADSNSTTLNNNLAHVAIATWSTVDNTGRLYIDGTTAATSTLTAAGSIVHTSTDENAAGASLDSGNAPFTGYVGNMPEWLSSNAVPSAGDLNNLWTYLRGRAGI